MDGKDWCTVWYRHGKGMGDFLRAYCSLQDGTLRPTMVWSGERSGGTRFHANFWGNHGVYHGSDHAFLHNILPGKLAESTGNSSDRDGTNIPPFKPP